MSPKEDNWVLTVSLHSAGIYAASHSICPGALWAHFVSLDMEYLMEYTAWGPWVWVTIELCNGGQEYIQENPFESFQASK